MLSKYSVTNGELPASNLGDFKAYYSTKYALLNGGINVIDSEHYMRN